MTPPPGDKTATVAFAEDGLERLRIGLMEAGLDARYFAWPPENDPERAPYRGLEPLEAEDAGIFFGRDGPTVVGLDLLRGLREAAPPRLLVILGASGAGKSSFLRAGLLPRLARESQHFLPLPVIRPERAVLAGEAGLIASLEKALKEAELSRYARRHPQGRRGWSQRMSPRSLGTSSRRTRLPTRATAQSRARLRR